MSWEWCFACKDQGRNSQPKDANSDILFSFGRAETIPMHFSNLLSKRGVAGSLLHRLLKTNRHGSGGGCWHSRSDPSASPRTAAVHCILSAGVTAFHHAVLKHSQGGKHTQVPTTAHTYGHGSSKQILAVVWQQRLTAHAAALQLRQGCPLCPVGRCQTQQMSDTAI